MTTRLLSHTVLSIATIATLSLTACPGGNNDDGDPIRKPYVDDWETVAELPASQFTLLSVGDRISSDNYANRGDIEVRYVAGTSAITIEMQRFTVADDEGEAQQNFDKMEYWGYSISAPEKPSDDNAQEQCMNPDGDVVDRCFVRAYYDGLFQPSRDGANFRVTVPEGWGGDLELTTSDNLEEGVETYPDRSDVLVDGLNGNLIVDLDSGNVQVRADADIPHYAGCSSSAECEDMGFPMGCGCSVPTNITVENNTGQASNITIDVGSADNWYQMLLENRGSFSTGDEITCTASVDCAPFDKCTPDEAFADDPAKSIVEANFPDNGMATSGAGIRIALTSEDCAEIPYVDSVEDHGSESLPLEKRGDVLVCVGCLSDL